MAEVMPFAGTRYAAKEAAKDGDRDLAEMICPPFDQISPTLQKKLHKQHPNNIVRLVFGHEAPSDDDMNNRYSRSAECYRDWKARGILADEQRKCFYIYEQERPGPAGGEPVRSMGFFALVKLQDFRSQKILAYQLTYDTPRADRLKLLRTTQLNQSPIHMLYRDEDDEVNTVVREGMRKLSPVEEFTTPDGVTHRLWMMHKKDPILRIHEAMKPKRLVIADGHDLYETALQYRDEMRDMTGRRDGRQPYDFALMYLQRAESEAMYTTPVHRALARELALEADVDEVLEDLGEYFTLSEFKLNMKDLDKAKAQVEDKVKPTKAAKTRFVMALPSGRAWTLSLKKGADVHEMIDEETMSEELKSMDIVLLHNFIITRGWVGNPDVELDEDDLFYCREIDRALDLIKRRKACVAFFLNPHDKEELMRVAEYGELLPHYPVDFHPKVPSGLVMRDLNVGFG